MFHFPLSPVASLLLLLMVPSLVLSLDGPAYDSTAYTECKAHPEEPLYNGGILGDGGTSPNWDVLRPTVGDSGGPIAVFHPPATFLLFNLTAADTKYSFSGWVKIEGADSALVRTTLKTEDATHNCIGTVTARSGCWSFLKGGFVLRSPSPQSTLFLQNSDAGADIKITIASASLQPFTDRQWRLNQDSKIRSARKRAVIIHVSDRFGERLQGAVVTVQQVAKDFPFGSAIASTIIGNSAYQEWFLKRFNAAVFENELKWYATEPEQGKINYTLADQLLQFVHANQLIARGHNIFWEDPVYNPAWVRNLTGYELHSAVEARIQSLMNKYREEFIHWDVSNEMLHFRFYEERLGPNATLHFFETAHQSDPLATLFMNEFNVVETCSDAGSTVDTYIWKLKELERGGVSMDGIGLESHFTTPNPPLMRAILDKLARLGLPIWLTEVDISKTIDMETQAIYLEEVLREGFSHSAVDGMMLWTAIHPNGCYQMCLTHKDFQNLPAGDVVDRLLEEWQTGEIRGETDGQGSYAFFGFLGEYKVSVKHGNTTAVSSFSLSRDDETKHFNIHL